MHETFVLVRDISDARPPANHIEKQTRNWPGYREKPHMRPRHPTNLKLKTQKTTSAKRAIFLFSSRRSAILCRSNPPLSERPPAKPFSKVPRMQQILRLITDS